MFNVRFVGWRSPPRGIAWKPCEGFFGRSFAVTEDTEEWVWCPGWNGKCEVEFDDQFPEPLHMFKSMSEHRGPGGELHGLGFHEFDEAVRYKLRFGGLVMKTQP
jgi:hypothetical protein